jgi:transposase-like protein
MPAKLPARFTDSDAARKYLEGLLWQDGPVCAHCKILGHATPLKGKSTRPGVYWCNGCRKPFSITVGTIYESSKIPLNVWLYANHQLCSARKAISGLQLARMLGVSYKTAWFMAHHIREAMVEPAGASQRSDTGEASSDGRQNGPR